MKKIIAFIFLISFAWGLQLKGQIVYSYVPFTDNSEWSVNTVKYKTLGDTIIAGKNYLKMYSSEANQTNYFCAIRNDTVTKKVYGIYHEPSTVYALSRYGHPEALFTTTDTTELLLYDFSLQFGDSITYYLFCDDFFSFHEIFQLKAARVWECNILVGDQGYSHISQNYYGEDSLLLMEDGSLRKKILLRSLNMHQGEDQFWVEGIGSSSGVVVPWYNDVAVPLDYPYTRLLCYSQNDELIYRTEFDISDNDSTDCFSGGFGGAIKENNINSLVNLYPNPVTDNITVLTNDNQIPIKSIEIYSMTGQFILSVPHPSGNSITIPFSQYHNGMYIMKILLQDQSCKTYKIIKS